MFFVDLCLNCFIFAAEYLIDMGKDECIKLLKKYMTILKEKYGVTSLIHA